MYDKKPTKEDKLFFYGSLRKGDYNHASLEGKDPINFATLRGYKMHSLGAYPFIIESKDETDTIIGEIYSDLNPEQIEQIDNMELGAGYHRELVNVVDKEGNKHETIVYVYDSLDGWDKLPPHVENGDWLDFKSKNKQSLFG